MSEFLSLCYWDTATESLMDLESNHAIQAMVTQLPKDKAAWTPEQRDQWMRAFNAVLDFAHPDSVKPRQQSIDEILAQVSRSFGPPAIKPLSSDTQAPPLADLIEKAGRESEEDPVDNFESNFLASDRQFHSIGRYQGVRDAAKTIRRMIRAAGNKPAQIVYRRTDGRIRVCAPGYQPEQDEIEIGTFTNFITLNDFCEEIEKAIAG